MPLISKHRHKVLGQNTAVIIQTPLTPCANDHPLLESRMQWGGCGCVGTTFIKPWLSLPESKSLHMTLWKWGRRCNDKFVLESQSLVSSRHQAPVPEVGLVRSGFPYAAKGAKVPWLMDSSWKIWRFTSGPRLDLKLEGHQEIVQLRTVLTALPLDQGGKSSVGQVCASECIVSC